MYCPRCGSAVAASDKFCSACGEMQAAFYQADITAMPSDPRVFYRAFLGPESRDYYLSRFARFDERGRVGPSWHWPAFFFTFFWMIYRKLWLPAFAYIAISGPIAITARLCAGNYQTAVDVLINTSFFVVPALFANALYYRYCRRKIEQTKLLYDDAQALLEELERRGGPLGRLTMIFVVVPLTMLLWGVCILSLAAFLVQGVNDHLQRAHAYGQSATTALSAYVRRYDELPDTLRHAGFRQAPPPDIEEVSFNGRTGKLILTVDGGPLLRHKHLQWRLERDTDGGIEWICSSRDIADLYLPEVCKKSAR